MNIAATNKNLSRRHRDGRCDKCPCCTIHVETASHVLLCPEAGRVEAFQLGTTALEQWLDEASRFMWVFLTKSKEPPLDIINSFLRKFGHEEGGSISSDQGGDLAKSPALTNMVLRDHNYVFEPTGADSPSHNGGVETYNDKLAVRTRTLLYGANLPATYWSAALLHVVYLNNRLVHMVTKKTPFEGFYGHKPDIEYLKMCENPRLE